MEEATELEYLTFFRVNADFGPGHSDVMFYLNWEFERQTGKRVPANWRDDEEEE